MAAPREEAAHRLHCREIWGGIEAADVHVELPGIDAWVYARPHGGASGGGDIHYLGLCSHGLLSRFVVADVAGHGAAVAEVAQRLRGLMAEHMDAPDQSDLVRDINDAFEQLSPSEEFATAVVASYLSPMRHLLVVNAGHPRPLWYSRADDQWRALTSDVPRVVERLLDLPLGVVAGTGYTQFAMPLSPGDLVLLYTDSLTEACDASGRRIGEAGLLRLVRSLDPSSPAGLRPGILDAIGRCAGRSDFDDDVTLVTLHHTGRRDFTPEGAAP